MASQFRKSDERPVFLFTTAMDFNSSISSLLNTGNLDLSGHVFEFLGGTKVYFSC